MDAIDESGSQIDAIKQRKISETDSLASQLKLTIGAQVMLTSNLGIENRLMNGLVGMVAQLKYINNKVSVAYVKFNDDNAGLVAM